MNEWGEVVIMETVAMYLPQFHRVKENDEWWGEGFTEWTAVKQATSLYEGHKQPRIPLNDNYYDLLDKNTLYWQAELAQKYGVSGFCFYHYYFENGKKILEKPGKVCFDMFYRKIEKRLYEYYNNVDARKNYSA